MGDKWCTACKTHHPVSAFGRDRTRGDGLAASCLASRRVKVRKPQLGRPGRRGWQAPARDGDKRQARRRVNYLVERGLILRPDDLPCMDCGDEVFVNRYRHEYDHARGYDGENQLYVEPVCSKCHRNREDARHGA
jgi:hypothetical protein